MNLLHFLQEFNGYNKIGGGFLYSLYKDEDILSQGKIDDVINYIQDSTLDDTFLLINKDSININFARRALWISWYALKLERMLQLMETTHEYTSEIKDFLFKDQEMSYMEELLAAAEEGTEIEDDFDDEEDTLDDIDEDENDDLDDEDED